MRVIKENRAEIGENIEKGGENGGLRGKNRGKRGENGDKSILGKLRYSWSRENKIYKSGERQVNNSGLE